MYESQMKESQILAGNWEYERQQCYINQQEKKTWSNFSYSSVSFKALLLKKNQENQILGVMDLCNCIHVWKRI